MTGQKTILAQPLAPPQSGMRGFRRRLIGALVADARPEHEAALAQIRPARGWVTLLLILLAIGIALAGWAALIGAATALNHHPRHLRAGPTITKKAVHPRNA
jgi:hypothetical protein